MRSGIFIILLFLCAGQVFAGPTEMRKVFNKLVLAIGKNNNTKPTLRIVNDEGLIAVTSSTGEVLVGKQLIQYCSRFGADSINALATLLSHELVHYYKEHFWGHKFGSAYASSDWGKKISDLDTHRKIVELHETQADQLGFYYAFSAGYKTWKIAEPLLDSIYRWYHLNENLAGYPSLTQRKEMARTSASKFAKLIPVFEMSNLLKVISSVYQDDQQAALLDFSGFGYEHLFLENIQTAEMYNNIAVSKILKAQKFSASVFARLQLPLILDQSSMMYEVSHSKGEEEQEKFAELMADALNNLEMALKMDATYWPAAVNKSLVLIGLENYGSCSDVLNSKTIEEIIKTDKSVSAIVSEIRGILSYLSGDSVKSKALFKVAIKSGSSSARINEMVLKGRMDQVGAGIDPPNTRADTIEKWNGNFIYKGLKIYPTRYENKVIYANGKAVLFLDSFKGYKMFELKPTIGLCPIQKVKIAVNYVDTLITSRGLKTGFTTQELVSRYGNANAKVPGTLYSYWMYPRQKLVVMVDNTSNKVESWFYYMLD